MRRHPLLACCTLATAAAIATTGALEESAFASKAPPHEAAKASSVHLELRELAAAGTPAAHTAAPKTRLSGALPLTFVVTGGPVLGSYLPPAVRRAEIRARHRALAERHARQASHERLLAARRRARRARHAKAAARHHVYAPASGVWAELRACESGGNYTEDSGNGFYGAYQFLPSTWWALGFSGMPNEAPPAVQDRAAEELLQRQGWGAWPACSAKLGL